MSVAVRIRRASPPPPPELPIEEVTITMDLETARAVRAMCGLGHIHLAVIREHHPSFHTAYLEGKANPAVYQRVWDALTEVGI